MAGVCYLMKTLNRIRLLLVVAGWMLTQLRADAAETGLIPFALDAHDGAAYTQDTWQGRPLVLFISSREGAAHNEDRVWSRPLADFFSQYADDVMLAGVAHAPGLPRFIRGMARGMAAPTDDDPVRIRLMDWDGVFMQRYELPSEAYNVLVFGRSGQLVYRKSLRTFGKAELDSVLRELQPLVDAF
jgi:hypothetical protein